MFNLSTFLVEQSKYTKKFPADKVISGLIPEGFG